ncbi:rhodanese-like domain-containing protein [soil metagenome]
MTTNGVPTTDLSQLPNPLPADLAVLDVREIDEWNSGHIEGAIHIPLGEVTGRTAELDPQVQTLVVCHLGGRSARATAYLVQNGFDAVNLDGGMDAWLQAGRDVV